LNGSFEKGGVLLPVVYEASFDKDKCVGIVNDPRLASDLEGRWFGRRVNGSLILDIVEVAYLLLSGRMRLVSDDTILGLNDFMDKYYSCLKEFFWPRLVVYKDLRDRGRRVRIIGSNKYIVKDKYGDLRLVYVLEESRRVNVDAVSEIISEALDNGLKPVLAIVSLQGDLTYYEVTSMEPINK
jgi:tRNA-intron endonuclease